VIKQQNLQSGHAAILVEALALASPPIVYIVASQIAPEQDAFVMDASVRTVVILTILVGIIASWVTTRRSPRALLLLLAIFIPNAFAPADELFIKMRPTLTYMFVVAIVLWGTNSSQPFLKTVYGEILPLPKRVWAILTRVCIFAYVLFALLNEIIWRTQSTNTWIVWKQFVPLLIFGSLTVLLAVSIRSSLRIPPVERLASGGRDARWAVFVDRWMVLSSYSGLLVAPLAIGCLGAYLMRDHPTVFGTIQLVGLCAIVALSAHSILCWRHRGIGAGMYSPAAALAAIAGTITSGAFLFLLIVRHGENLSSDKELLLYSGTLTTYFVPAAASILVWRAGRRRKRRQNPYSAGPPAHIYTAFERALEVTFGRAKRSARFRSSYVLASVVLLLGWSCLLTPLAVPDRPSGAVSILMGYSSIVGAILLFYAAHVASRASINQPSINQPSIDQPRVAGPKTALLLRPFKEDTDSTGLFAPSFETQLAKVLSPYLSLVAIKSPGRMETFGASHVAYSHDVWQTEALSMMREAELIVLSLGETPGVQWEIEVVLSQQFYRKTVFVVPEPSARQKDWWMRVTSGFSNTIWASAVGALGDVAGSVRAFSVHSDGSVRVVYIGEQSHRSRAISVVLAACQLIDERVCEDRPRAKLAMLQ
jgi:intracellular septation protein A